MNLKLLTLFCALVSIAGVWADDNAGAERDLKKLQGVWNFRSVVRDGKEAEKIWGGKLKELKITFAADKFSVAKGNEVVQAGTHKLDPSKSPKTVDATVNVGEGKGKVMHGIYELKGNTLKVCFNMQGKKRPAKFQAAGGSGNIIIVHKRVKR